MKRLLAAALVLSALAWARAGDDELAAARAEFEAIVRYDAEDARCDEGPSLTMLVRRLLGHGPEIVRRVETEAWDASKRGDLFASACAADVERLVRLLHGMEQSARSGRFRVYAVDFGAVFEEGCAFISGPNWTPTPGTLDAVVGDRPLLRLEAAAAARLFAAVDAPDARRLDNQMIELATVLGEACTKDDAGFQELLKRADAAAGTLAAAMREKTQDDEWLGRTNRAKEADEFYALALGWSGRTESIERLVRRVVEPPPKRPRFGGLTPFDAAARALRHADPAEFDRVVGALGMFDGDRLAAAVGGPTLARRLLARLVLTKDGKPDRLTTLHFCGAVSMYHDGVHGPGVERVFRALLDAVREGDREVREAALAAASDALQAAPSRHVGRSSGSSSVGDDYVENYVWIGWPGATEELLRRVVEDLDAGRLVPADAPPGLFDAKPATPWPRFARAHTDVVLPGAPRAGADEPTPVVLSAEKTPDGLRLRLRNVCDATLAIDPVALRYCDAQDVDMTAPAGDPKARTERRLRLAFGVVGLRAVVPSRFLVTLARGATHEWSLPLRDELRFVDHFEVELAPSLDLVGPSTAPLVSFLLTAAL